MSTALRTYYRGHNLVAMRDEGSSSTRYYHFDHQGTTQCLTDSTGAVTDRFASDAWGVEVKRTGSSINRQWYIGNWGYYRQADRMPDYVRMRYLAPRTGTWLSRDLFWRHQPYLYGSNCPGRMVDPGGLRACNPHDWEEAAFRWPAKFNVPPPGWGSLALSQPLLCEAQAIRVQAAYAAYKAAASILQLPVFESFVEKYFLGSGKTEVLSTKTMQDLLISSKDDQRCCIRAVTDAMRFVEQTLFPPRKCTSIAKRKVFRHNGELGFPKVNWSDDNDLYMSIGGHSGWAKGSASCQCFANGGPEYFTMTFYYGVHDRALYNGASFEFLKQHLPPGWAPGPYPFANLLLFYLCGFARDFWVEGWRGTLFIGFGGSNPARQNFFCFANLEEAPAIVGPFRSAHARGLLWKVKDATSASSPRFS